MPIRRDAEGRWHAEACVDRRRLHRRLPEGATQGDAKLLEAELVRALHAQATQRLPAIPGDPPLTELLADYAERHALNLRSTDTAQFHAYRIGRWIEGRRASETRAVVAAIVEDLLPHYAPATINRSLGALRKSLRNAWERGRTPVDYSSLVMNRSGYLANRLAAVFRAQGLRRGDHVSTLIGNRLIAPLMLSALDDADHVAEALRARGGVM